MTDLDDQVPDTDPRRRQLADLQAGNQRAIQNLATQGVGINQGALINIRLEQLITAILGEDTTARLDYELGYEQRLAVMLDEAGVEIRRAKLLAGINGN
jgi:hypothetical protein